MAQARARKALNKSAIPVLAIPTVASPVMQYYDLQRNWTRHVVPHLDNPELKKILVRDFNRYTMGRWMKPFKSSDLPEDHESCDWRFSHRGPYPRYWSYVKHAACHWIVNFALRLAMCAEVKKEWRIVSSVEHSTVWDGKNTLFDFNFLALGIPIKETWQAARFGGNAEVLPLCEEREVGYASHYLFEMSDEQRDKYITSFYTTTEQRLQLANELELNLKLNEAAHMPEPAVLA